MAYASQRIAFLEEATRIPKAKRGGITFQRSWASKATDSLGLMPVEMLIVMGFVAATTAFGLYRVVKAKRTGYEYPFAPGLIALDEGFSQTRLVDESEPICVVAYHSKTLSVHYVIVGVTNQRILVVKDAGPMHQFAYDYDAEHLPEARKTAERSGFFHWSHSPAGYTPEVKDYAPFSGEEWLMRPVVGGHPDQKQNLRQFASLFYFQWFYD